jgi:hypothetical protein
MKKKILIIGIGTALTGVLAYLYFKYKADAKLDTSIANGDKITAQSLSDAQNKTSVQTTPVNLDEARALSALIQHNIKERNSYKKQSSKDRMQKDIDSQIQKLFEMGYISLSNGDIQKV